MWAALFLFAFILYFLIPKETADERQDQEDLVDEMLFLGDDEDDDDFLLEEMILLLDEEEDDDEF
jgi:hypothetical protein